MNPSMYCVKVFMILLLPPFFRALHWRPNLQCISYWGHFQSKPQERATNVYFFSKIYLSCVCTACTCTSRLGKDKYFPEFLIPGRKDIKLPIDFVKWIGSACCGLWKPMCNSVYIWRPFWLRNHLSSSLLALLFPNNLEGHERLLILPVRTEHSI